MTEKYDEIFTAFSKKYSFPTLINNTQSIGKTVKEIYSPQTWTNFLYIIYTDNTTLCITSQYGYEGALESPIINSDFSTEFIMDMIHRFYSNESPYPNPLDEEFWALYTPIETEERKNRQRLEYDKLKALFEKEQSHAPKEEAKQQ